MDHRVDTPTDYSYPAQSAFSALATAPIKGQGSTTSRAVAEAVFRHQRIFLWTFAAVFSLTGLYVLFVPRTYQSEMNILVRNARPDYLLSPEKSNGSSPQSDVTEEKVNSEVEVLRSKDVADTVVDSNWSLKPANEHTAAEIKAHEKSILYYGKHLTIESLRKSNVIRVTFTASTPRQANETLNHLLEAFLAKQREIEHSASASTFFATEAQRYKAELDQAQEQLATYQQRNQMVSLTEKEATLQTQINTLEDQIRATQVSMSEASNRILSGQSQMKIMPTRMPTSQRLIPNTYTVEQLSTLLANLQNQRTALLVKFLPNDRLVQELDKQISDTSATLKSATNARALEETTDINPVFEQVRGAVAQSHTELSGLTARLDDQNKQLNFLREALAGVEGSTVDYSTLQSRVTDLQANYQIYTQKRNEAEIADAMDRQNLVNVAVAERPTFSVKPYRPDPALDLSLGGFTAVFFAVCLVFFAEMLRDTIASPWELEALTRIPVLATVPLTEQGYSNPLWGDTPPRNTGPSRGSPEHDSSGGWSGADYAQQAPSGYLPPKPSFAFNGRKASPAPIQATPEPVQAVANLVQAGPSPVQQPVQYQAQQPTQPQPQSAKTLRQLVPSPHAATPIAPASIAAQALPQRPVQSLASSASESVDPPVTAAGAWFAKVKNESKSNPVARPSAPSATPEPTMAVAPILPPFMARPLQPMSKVEASPAPPTPASAQSNRAAVPILQPLPARFASSASVQAPETPAPAPRVLDAHPSSAPVGDASSPYQELPMFNFRKSAPTLLNLAELTADDAEESSLGEIPFDTRSRASEARPAAARPLEPKPEARPERRKAERIVLDDVAPVRDPIPRYMPPPRPSQVHSTQMAYTNIPDAIERSEGRRKTPRPLGSDSLLEGSRGEPRAYPRAPRRPDSQVFAAEQAAGTLPRDASAIVSKPKFFADDRTPPEPPAKPAEVELSASESQLIAIAQSEPVHRPSSARLAAIRDEIQGKRLSPSQRMRSHARSGFVAYSIEKEK